MENKFSYFYPSVCIITRPSSTKKFRHAFPFKGSYGWLVKRLNAPLKLHLECHDLTTARERGRSGKGEPDLFRDYLLGNNKGQFAGTVPGRTKIIHFLRPDPIQVVLRSFRIDQLKIAV